MLTNTDLQQFSGSQEFFKHWLGRFRFTEGVHYLAEKGECYWLMDAIASHQTNPKLRNQPFQLWTLRRVGAGAVLTCQTDTYAPSLVTQDIEFTDFPLDYIKLYLEDGTLFLPAER